MIEINDLAAGYTTSVVLQALREIGIERLAGKGESREALLRTVKKVNRPVFDAVLKAGAAMGFLRRRGDRFQLSSKWDTQELEVLIAYHCFYQPHWLGITRRMSLTGIAPRSDIRWQEYVARGHKVLFACIVREAPVGDVRRILDVGAGSGELGLGFLRRFPRARGTFLDNDKASLRLVAANIRDHAMARRACVRGADAERYLPRDDKFGLIILSNLLHLIDRERRINFVTKCADSLTDEGSILLVEPLLGHTARRNYFFNISVMIRSLGRGGLLCRKSLTSLMRGIGCKRRWSFEASDELDLFGRRYSAYLYSR